MARFETILVIEDEQALQDAIQIKLKKAGYTVLFAMTAERGLEIIKSNSKLPDLIWLDLLLPGMGGLQFLEVLRENPDWKDVPVMVASVSASPEKIQRAFHLNVVDYIVKSQYRLEDIINRVNTIFEEKNK